MITQPIFVRWSPPEKEQQRAILYMVKESNNAIIINPSTRQFIEVPLTELFFDKWDY